MENQVKGATALELLTMAFIIFKLVGLPPFDGWSYFGLILSPIYLQLFFKFCFLVWERMGFRKQFYAELELKKYNRDLKKETERFKQIAAKANDERLAVLKQKIEKSNADLFAANQAKQNEAGK